MAKLDGNKTQSKCTIFKSALGPLLTRHLEPVTITLQALSLVEEAKPVQVRFTLRLRDQRFM
jgi:hypothetical protein